MKKQLKKIPKFKSNQDEDLFWQKVDSTEYVDYSNLRSMQFPNLRLTSKPVTIRIPEGLLNRLKIMAHQQDIPYQSLIKQFLYKAVNVDKSSSHKFVGQISDKGDAEYETGKRNLD